ncbi:flavoprotein, partial [Mycolicibacterium farcinogenes]|nr:flavoprotein [Mycolicibacterium farcinogenes]
MSNEYVETVIVGAGQQGCGVAGALHEIGREAIVFEKGEVGQRWANERWDSLLVGSGNRSIRLPGWDYDGDDPLALPSGPQVAGYLRRYVHDRNLTVRERTRCRPSKSVRRARRRRAVPDPATRRRDGRIAYLVAAVGATPNRASQFCP